MAVCIYNAQAGEVETDRFLKIIEQSSSPNQLLFVSELVKDLTSKKKKKNQTFDLYTPTRTDVNPIFRWHTVSCEESDSYDETGWLL